MESVRLSRKSPADPIVRWAAAVALLLGVGLTSPGLASDLQQFNGEVAAVNEHYRAARSYLHTGNIDLALIELDDATAGWSAITERYGAAAPDAFSDDPAWRETLADIGRRIGDGLTAAESGDAEAAQRHLAGIRGLLSDLRRRNGVRVFSDEVDEVSAAMDTLWKFRTSPPSFDSAVEIRSLLDASAVLVFLVDRCRALAPADTVDDPSFARIVDSTLEAAGRLQHAVDQRNERLLINTLRELRAYEQMLWLKFG